MGRLVKDLRVYFKVYKYIIGRFGLREWYNRFVFMNVYFVYFMENYL